MPRLIAASLTFVVLGSLLFSVSLASERSAFAAEPPARVEVLELRTESSKTYRNADGTFATVLFETPVHFKDGRNRWQPISSKLVGADQPGFAWRSEANRFRASFAGNALGKFLRLDVEGGSYSLSLEEPTARAGATRLSDPTQIAYDGVASGLGLRYRMLPDGLEERLVLANADAPALYRFRLSGSRGALRAEQLADRSWVVRREASVRPLFTIPALYVWDAAGAEIDGATPPGADLASLAVTEADGDLLLELQLDEAWLRSPERRFPVVVDPTILVQPAVEDAIFFADQPDWSASSRRDRFEIGADDQHVKRAALKFDLSAIPVGADVSDAQLKIYFDSQCMGDCAPSHQLDVHQMTADWSRSSVTADLEFDPTALSSFSLPSWASPQWMSWDVTGTAVDWLAGTDPNYGLLVKRDMEALNSGGPMPHASGTEEPSLRPLLEVTYDGVGVELLEPPTVHSDGADLNWTPWDPPGGEPFEQYEVHRSMSPSFTPDSSTLLATVTDVAVTSYRDTSAAPGGTFTYKVVANGQESNARTVTLPADGQASKVLRLDQEEGEAAFLEYVDGTVSCDNTGAFDQLYIGTWGSTILRPILAFDLRDVPTGSTVTEATLSLWNQWPKDLGTDIEAHRVTAAWTEGSGQWVCSGDGATWHETEPGVRWTNAGGDFDSAVADSIPAGGGWERWDSFDIASLAQQWISGEAPNHGVLLKLGNESLTDANVFWYSDDWAASPTLRPKLSLTYADGSHAHGPEVALATPGAGEQVEGDAVQISAAASDDRRVEEVEFLVDGNVVGSRTSAPFELDWDSTTVTNGDHELTARARDDAGNVTTSAAVTAKVENSAPPATSVTDPAAGTDVTGTTTISASGTDDVGVTKVEFYVDDVRIGEDTTAPYEVNWDTLDPTEPAYDGTVELMTRAYDTSGQVVTSARKAVNVKNAAPTKYKATFSTTPFPQGVVYDPAAGTQEQHGINVTVTNQSAFTWSASSIYLRYRWVSPGSPTVVTDGPLVSLGSNLAAGASRMIPMLVTPPALADGVDKAQYRLRVDLYDTSVSAFFASKGNKPRENPVIVNKALTTALGLERYYQYEGEALGAGMEHLVNVANGDSLLRWSPFQAPGRGLSTVVDLTYNSLEEHSESPIGNNFSLAISSLVRFGNPLDVHPNNADQIVGRSNRWIEFVDGDGTTHRFEGKQALDGTVYWEEPAGVHLYLRTYSDTDPARKWAITRPDRVTFFFDEDGYPTFVRDRNGNEIAFTVEEVPSGEDPGGQKKRITEVVDAAGREFVLDYLSKAEAKKAQTRGKLERISDHTGSALDFDYYEDGNLLRITQRGGTNADGSFLPDRSFVFTYTTSDGSGPAISDPAARVDPEPRTSPQSTRLFSVRDPRGTETTFAYCSASNCGSSQNRWKLKTRTDRATNTTSYAYNISTRVTTVTAPLARTTSYGYDGQGSPTSITNPKNELTTLQWSADRHLSKVTQANGAYAEYTYNANGHLTDEKVLLDRKAAGTADDVLAHTKLEYEDLAVDGNDVSGKWKAGRTIPHLSQLVRKTDPKGTATATPTDDFQWLFAYDTNGNLTDVTDPEGFLTKHAYNANGTLASTTDARGVATPADPNDFKSQFLDYDGNGFPARVIDANGKTTRFGYDADGLLRTIQDPLHASDSGANAREYKVTLDYDSFHRLGRQSAPKSTRHERGKLIWSGVALDANDNVTAEYGPDYDLLETATPKRATTYDAMDRPTRVTGDRNPAAPGDEKTDVVYDAAGRPIKVTLPKGVDTPGIANDYTTEYLYDLLDRVITEIRYPADGSSATARRTHSCYDLAGDLRWLTAPKANLASAPTNCPAGTPPGFTGVLTYDDAQRLISEKDPLARTRSRTYDANGNVASETNASGDATSYTYDERNLKTKAVEPFATGRTLTTKLEYDPVGNLARLISPRAWDTAGGVAPFTQHVTSYNYDPLNRLVRQDLPTSSAYPQAQYVHQAYDANGNLSWSSLPVTAADPATVTADQKTEIDSFDPGWIRTSTDTANATVHFDYTAEGWQASRTPENTAGRLVLGRKMQWFYHDDGLLKEIVDTDEGRVSLRYDANANLMGATDDAGLASAGRTPIEVEASYNGFDETTKSRSRERADNEWRFTTFAYDANANLSERIDNGKENLSGGLLAAGRKNTFTYDQADWLTQQIDEGPTTSATDNRRITTAFFPTGWEQTRTIARYNGTVWQTKQTTNWTYFTNGKLKTLQTKNRAGAVVESHTLSYENAGVYANGHRTQDVFTLKGPGSTSCSAAACTATYAYDPRERLVSFGNGHGQTTSYTLNTAGSIVTEATTGKPTRTFAYTGTRVDSESVTGSGEIARYFYDVEGNLDCATDGSGSASDCPAPEGGTFSPRLRTAYAYDSLNRMASYRTFAAGVEQDRSTYVYDALDRPVKEQERHGASGSQRTTIFTYLGLSDSVSEERHENALGVPIRTKTYGYDAFGHRLTMTNTPAGQATQTYGYAYDVHGSASLLLNDNQDAATSSYAYGPYGEIDTTLTKGVDDVNATDPTKPPNDPLNPYRYTGKRLDSGSGSYDMGARRYSSSAARFLQQDLYMGAFADLSLTLDPLTQNRYALAGGNPSSYVELDGNYPAEDGKGGATRLTEPASDKMNRRGAWQEGGRPTGPDQGNDTVFTSKGITLTDLEEIHEGLGCRSLEISYALGKICDHLNEEYGRLGGGTEWGGYVLEAASTVAGPGKVYKGFQYVYRGYKALRAAKGGAAVARSGLAAEKSVSGSIGVARNAGAGRVTIPGSGPGGYRVPDFDPALTIAQRGTVVEVKNVTQLSSSAQLRDLQAYANSRGVPLEIFTNAQRPRTGQLADAISAGLVRLTPIP